MGRSSGQLTDNIVRYIRALPAPALNASEGVSDVAYDTATGTVKFGAAGGTTKELADLSTAQTFTGAKSFTDVTYGLRRLVSVYDGAAATLTASNSGQTLICTAASGTQIFTLPAAATGGVVFTFICAHASGEIRVAVATGDNIIGKTHGAENGAGILTTATTGYLKNTEATNVVGDFCTLMSDGITTWYMVAVAGVWAGA